MHCSSTPCGSGSTKNFLSAAKLVTSRVSVTLGDAVKSFAFSCFPFIGRGSGLGDGDRDSLLSILLAEGVPGGVLSNCVRGRGNRNSIEIRSDARSTEAEERSSMVRGATLLSIRGLSCSSSSVSGISCCFDFGERCRTSASVGNTFSATVFRNLCESNAKLASISQSRGKSSGAKAYSVN